MGEHGTIRPRTVLGLILAQAVVMALTGTAAGLMCIPASARLTSEIVCPKGYQRSVVVLEVRHPEDGVTDVSSSLYCVYAGEDDFPTRASSFAVTGALF